MDIRDQIVECIPALRRYALTLTKNVSNTEDLVQDTLVRAFSKIHLFVEGNVKSWLLTIMHNCFVNNIRDAVRETNNHLPLEYADEIKSVENIIAKIELKEVADRISQMPIKHQRVLLAFTLGDKYQEIGDAEDIPLNTVRSRLYRSREALRALD